MPEDNELQAGGTIDLAPQAGGGIGAEWRINTATSLKLQAWGAADVGEDFVDPRLELLLVSMANSNKLLVASAKVPRVGLMSARVQSHIYVAPGHYRLEAYFRGSRVTTSELKGNLKDSLGVIDVLSQSISNHMMLISSPTAKRLRLYGQYDAVAVERRVKVSVFDLQAPADVVTSGWRSVSANGNYPAKAEIDPFDIIAGRTYQIQSEVNNTGGDATGSSLRVSKSEV